MKYFYCTVKVLFKCQYFRVFFFRKLYFTTFQSLIVYFYCTTLHIKYPLILNYIRNLLLSYFYSSKNNKMLYLSTSNYYICNVLKY